MVLRSASLKSNNICLASYASSGVQFYHVAIDNGMIWSYLLSIECPASPEPSKLQRASYILVHKPSDIRHRVAPMNDERTCPVGWLAGWLRVYTYDSQCAEHER